MNSVILFAVFAAGLLWTLRSEGAVSDRLLIAGVGAAVYVGLFRIMRALIVRAERTEMPARVGVWLGFLALVFINLGIWWGLDSILQWRASR